MRKLVCFLFAAGMLMGVASCDQIKDWKDNMLGRKGNEEIEMKKEELTDAARDSVVQKVPKKKKVVKRVVVKKVIKK